MSESPAAGPDVAMETSRREASLALGVGETVLSVDLGAAAHARDLVPGLERLLAEAGVERRGGKLELAAVIVGLGPGSYTGLRVGIATGAALARATGASLHGLSSFEALAFGELAPGQEATVAMDARAGRFYHARYRRTEGGLEVLDPPAALEAEELARRCAHARLVLGDAGLASAAGLSLPAGSRLRTDVRPSARALLELARARRTAGALAAQAALEPLYLAGFGKRTSDPRSAGR